jgi:hypothetical protein
MAGIKFLIKRGRLTAEYFTAFAIVLLIIPTFLQAQLSIKNQADYTNWQDYNRQILENWTDITYQRSDFILGGRYEINKPPDPFIFPQDSLLQEFDLTFAFAEYDYKNWGVRAGNFYSMFGRGLILRTYEDRNLRVDNNIFGGAVSYNSDLISVKAIAGKMRDKYNRRKEFMYGVDAQVSPISSLQIGASFLQQDATVSSAQSMSALRLNYFWDWGDVYAESVKPEWSDAWSHYAGLTGFVGDFTFIAEYKNYNRISFKNSYGAEYNAAPSLTREHSFTMLNRHPHALNMDDETGWQFEATWSPSLTWGMTANNSKTFTRSGQRIFEEYYIESHNFLMNELIETHLATAWNFDFSTNTENITTVVDPQLSLSERDVLHLSWQHQHTKNIFDQSEYDTELLQIEYSRSPFGSFALVGEYTNKYQLNNVDMDRHTWLYGQLTLNFWHNQEVQLLYGSRQAGFVCVGGICRYEPEFRGFEVRMVNRF